LGREILVLLGMGGGLVGGPFFAYLAARPIVLRLMRGARYPAVVATTGVTAGAVAAAASLFPAFVIGGNLGGGWVGWVFGFMGLELLGVSLGLALGIGLVLACGIWACAVVGALLSAAIGPKSNVAT
jgi:hypothetical protein